MTTTRTRSVRYAFASALAALTLFAAGESLLGHGPAAAEASVAEGLAACGTADAPCVLDVVTVEAQPSASVASAGTTACGGADSPCLLEAVTVEARPADTRLASGTHAPQMKLRLRS